jgi:hypothetical protein
MRKWLVLLSLVGLLALSVILLATCASGDWHTQLTYIGPVEVGIDQGQFLPGTNLQYIGRTEDGARVSIGGQQALKKIGDSLDWQGDMHSGVAVTESLRVALVTEETLHAAGTVRIDIASPNPQVEQANDSAPVHFKLPVAYRVAKDEAIPGTVVTYLGKTDQGARLGNVQGYEYRQVGDSITWEGKLRDGAWIELVVRTALISDNSLDVIGTVDVWIVPEGPSAQ